MESNSVCNHTSDNKIGRPRSGSPICLSRVLLQTELDDTKSYYQLIIKITISEKNSQVVKKGKVRIKIQKQNKKRESKNTKASARARTRNYNFECDWLF